MGMSQLMGVVFGVIGGLLVVGSWRDWNWLQRGKGRFWAALFGRNGARVVYFLMGSGFTTLGVLLMVGILIADADGKFRVAKRPQAPAKPAPARAQSSKPAPQRPPAPAPAAAPAARVTGPVDLLAIVQPNRDQLSGIWEMEGPALVTPQAGRPARLQFAIIPPEDYKVSFTVERLAGNESFNVVLPVGGRHVNVTVEGWGKGYSGLNTIGGKFGHDNETTVTQRVFRDGQPNTVVCIVRGNRIGVGVNGTKIIDWQGDPKLLKLSRFWENGVLDGRVLVGSWASKYRITRALLEPL